MQSERQGHKDVAQEVDLGVVGRDRSQTARQFQKLETVFSLALTKQWCTPVISALKGPGRTSQFPGTPSYITSLEQAGEMTKQGPKLGAQNPCKKL